MPTSPPEAVPGDALTILDLGSEPDDKITVLRSQLLRYFEYFKQYSDLQWPASFVIKSPNAEAATWCVVPASAGNAIPRGWKLY